MPNTTPSKAEQDAEARARAERVARGDSDPASFRGDPERAAETIEADGDADFARVAAAGDGGGEDPPERPQVRLRSDPRDDIVARYRESRNTEGPELDPSDQMLPEGMRTARTQPEPELEEEEEAPEDTRQPEQQPAKRTLIVRGEKRDYTQDEIDAIAQKALATDSYSDEALRTARETLEEAKRVRTETSTARGGATGTHPAGDTTQPTDEETGEHPAADPLDEAIEALQYGQPEAKEKLREVITTLATQAATGASSKVQQDRLYQEDTDNGARAIATFSEKHADLVSDDIARGAIEAAMYLVQREDLEKAGFTADKLRETFKREPSPRDISNLHKKFRVERVPGMRSHDQMFDEARGRYEKHLESRGVRTAPKDPPAERQQTEQPPRREAVKVNTSTIERDGRRAAIPQSPRSTPSEGTVRVVEPPKQQGKRDPSEIVAEIAASRQKAPVGIRPR